MTLGFTPTRQGASTVGKFAQPRVFMEQPWFILSRRCGADVREPSVEALRSALIEVFFEDLPRVAQADDEEHTYALVWYGTDTGPMYVLCFDRSRAATLEQWADQDFGDELADSLALDDVSLEQAIHMCALLKAGHVGALRNEFVRNGR